MSTSPAPKHVAEARRGGALAPDSQPTKAYFPETAYHLPPWPCDNTELLRAYLLSSYGVPHVPGA